MPNNDVYLGNPLLKKANTTHEFTEEQVLEIARCMNDPVYFAKNYVKIVNIGRSGFFSTDRTIQQYVDDIWKLKKII